MLWVFRVVMFVGYAVIGAAVARTLMAFVAQEWRIGLKRAALTVGLLIVSLVCMGLLGAAYTASQVDGTRLRPIEKARFLGEAIATQMNLGAIGLVPGVVLGVLIERRRQRRR